MDVLRPHAHGQVGLLDVEPDLAAQVPLDDLARAADLLRAPVVEFDRDRRPALDGAPGTLWLVLSGALLQRTVVAGRANAMLLGAGDLVRRPPASEPMADCVSLRVVQSCTVAVLDERFRAAVGRWPALSLFVEERLAVQAHRLALHAATCTLPRVQDRIVAALEQIAECWGRVRRDGTFVELDISHRTLGEIVGAQRPTVTLALHDLAADGRLHRVDGGWLLRSPGEHARSDGHALAPIAAVA
jgi:CRP/FNR family transcriptional regulator, cyclic AMP receptor protein